MTGFGEVQRETGVGTLNVQIRTVNHRHFHTHFRLPAGAERWETELTRIVRDAIARGHVHYRMEFQPGPGVVRPVEVDHDRIASYVEALEEVKRRHGIEGAVDVSLIARFPDVFAPPSDELEQLSFDELAAATRDALAAVLELREQEGDALARDLLDSLDQIDTALAAIETRAPQRLLEERDRLRRAVSELAADVSADEDRLAREIAYLAERWDINEEIVRLRSHVDQFRALVQSAGGEPAGKRLGFWVQEMHREANTIGSKANDAEIARLAVDVKTAIEKLREQVENVE
ncbi:MAG: YicC family protein [Gemmatimonadetes bacterium]|uniref:YicC family protein n=1 Tax=Candidatus Kutchimonas denitrificans TaxID=3056748 RepID=A0AAE4Z9K1_9BACT|nr:YicC family protein [Gemmatimonadota bacterium]NIR75177.1 YicC family protein [Candidatus Kutchimonas denitrificans]NIS00115.1 YicC family protein [Gemmatimonadota bacterium]NIT65707.1 YicC family protein [Gemmatimonadota bacterium]NIV23182.1 YicC family protein [Gemmatimonadota bacterium]